MNSFTKATFDWTEFYMKFADSLRAYKNKRLDLLLIIEAAHKQAGLKYPFMEQAQPIDDICPFTVFGSFNKYLKPENRISLAKAIGEHLGVQALVPSEFDGIPILNNMNAWFFGYKAKRQPHDIDSLWEMFEAALNYADNNGNNRDTFINNYNNVIKQDNIKWNITMGLYWIRPYQYLNLDEKNRHFLLKSKKVHSLGIKNISTLKQLPDADLYLKLVELCRNNFSEKESFFHNFPELSLAAWLESASQEQPQPQSETNEKHYWIYAPGKGANKWKEYYAQGIMGIGWDKLGDLESYSSREDIRTKMKNLLGEGTSYSNDSLALWQFFHDIQVGDIIYVKKGVREIVGRGIVESNYEFAPERTEHKHIRKVKWTYNGKCINPGQSIIKTLTDITNYTEYIQKLELAIAEDDNYYEIDEEKEIIYESYTEKNFLNDVFIKKSQYETMVKLLEIKKNIILQGAPGVGKTFIAKRLAYSIIGEKDTSRVTMVQFHQSYSYEDFIMGFRPTKDGFERTPGPFYKFCKDAQDDLERDYFFIIDEINRGNLSKIFGELLMLIEHDKRGEKLRILYANELFSVPRNVHIIGLMNTADRSLAMIDYALRRRFAFYEIEPAFDSDGFKEFIEQSNNNKFIRLIEKIKELNEAISKDESLGDGFKIGHSYFCTNDDVTSDWLISVVKFELLPLLHEYWFDEKSKVEDWEKKLLGSLND